MQGDALTLAWNIGAQWRISPNTTLGIAYHYQDKFELSGDCDLDTTGGGLPVTDGFKDDHRISADVKWIDWFSAFDMVWW
jgi:long-subunit fatty acid transport protein